MLLPGLDGWRAQELKLFTPCDLEPVANFFSFMKLVNCHFHVL